MPDDNTKPLIGTASAPINVGSTAIPYVPPLANTFASTNVVPTVPVGKSDAEIVFAGVAKMNLANQPTAPVVPNDSTISNQLQNFQVSTTSQLPQQHQQQHLQQLQTNNQIPLSVPNPSQQTAESAAVSLPQTFPPPSNQQQPQIFGSMPPTSIPSLNESFNISPAINPIPTSYQLNAQGNFLL